VDIILPKQICFARIAISFVANYLTNKK
jgi:hypothetical protein